MKVSAVWAAIAGTCIAALAIGSCGCATAGYLWQAAGGQCEISAGSRPLGEVIADPETPQPLAELLREVGGMKRFAEEMGLEPTPNYTEYVDLPRPVAVYVVSAAHPLRFEGKSWSFPIVGSVPYLGWFEKADAVYHARELREDGWDVDLRGAAAYSTLGWFEDPILSSMVAPGEEGSVADLANTVLHESAHATLYVESQSIFNESMASFVGDRLSETYIARRFGKDAPELRAIHEAEERSKRRFERLHEAYVDLEELYASNLSDEAKLVQKAHYLYALQIEVSFSRPINNATLMGFKTYHTGDELFADLFEACGQDWERFWAALRPIDGSAFQESQQEDLEPLLKEIQGRHCP
jgi:predicted aminopeptidase